MSLGPFLPLQRLAAAGLACLALAAAPGALAGVVVSNYTYSYDADNPPDPSQFRFNSSPFGFAPGAVPESGVVSIARAVDNRRSRLPSGPNRATVFEDVSKDSGFKSSTTAGQTVVAHADVSGTLLPAPLLGPAVARSMSEQRALHASASTAHQLTFFNSAPVVIDGTSFEPDHFYLQHRRTASATSAWFESWTATDTSTASITLALDGHLGFDPFCSSGNLCGVSGPAGTDAVRSDEPYVSLDAKFLLVDLTQLILCEDPDACGTVGVGHPLPLNILTAHYHGDDGLPFDYMDEWTLSFNTTVGHRYLLLGVLEVEAQSGGVIDFFNTMRITGVDVARGVLRSDATGGDVVDLFGQDPGVVPVPATLWLLLLGGGAAVLTRRRSRRD